MAECVVVIVVDNDGNYAIGVDEASAGEAYAQDFDEPARRVVRLTVQVPEPVYVEVEVDVPAEETGEPVVTVK